MHVENLKPDPLRDIAPASRGDAHPHRDIPDLSLYVDGESSFRPLDTPPHLIRVSRSLTTQSMFDLQPAFAVPDVVRIDDDDDTTKAPDPSIVNGQLTLMGRVPD
jgi:hypothetical protein